MLLWPEAKDFLFCVFILNVTSEVQSPTVLAQNQQVHAGACLVNSLGGYSIFFSLLNCRESFKCQTLFSLTASMDLFKSKGVQRNNGGWVQCDSPRITWLLKLTQIYIVSKQAWSAERNQLVPSWIGTCKGGGAEKKSISHITRPALLAYFPDPRGNQRQIPPGLWHSSYFPSTYTLIMCHLMKRYTLVTIIRLDTGASGMYRISASGW